MSDLENRIGSINNKLQQLIDAHKSVKQENAELKEAVVRLSRELNTKESLITRFNTELETREKESASAENNAMVKAEMEAYMNEIDACIEMVNELV